MDGSFFNIIMLAISLYVLYAGIVGKGRLYQADNIKEECKERFHSLMRKMFLGLGVVMVIMSVCNFTPQIAFKEEARIFVFNKEYTAPDGAQYAEGDVISYDQAVLYSQEEPQPEGAAGGGLCAPAQVSPDSIASKGTTEIIYEQRIPQLYGDDFEQKDYDNFKKGFAIAGGVLMGVSVLILVGLFIIINKMTDKEKKQEQRKTAQQGAPSMPSSAFDFDDEDTSGGNAQQ